MARFGNTALALGLAPLVAACVPGASDREGMSPARNPILLRYDTEPAVRDYYLEVESTRDGQHFESMDGYRTVTSADGRTDLYLTRMTAGSELKTIGETRRLRFPIADFKWGPLGAVEARRNPQGVLAEDNSLAESLIFMLPIFPTEPVGVGDTWAGRDTMPLSPATLEHPELDLEYELLALEDCPGLGKLPCAKYRVHVETGLRKTKMGTVQTPSLYDYTLEGNGYLSLDGEFVRAESTMHGTIRLDGVAVQVDGHFVLSRVGLTEDGAPVHTPTDRPPGEASWVRCLEDVPKTTMPFEEAKKAYFAAIDETTIAKNPWGQRRFEPALARTSLELLRAQMWSVSELEPVADIPVAQRQEYETEFRRAWRNTAYIIENVSQGVYGVGNVPGAEMLFYAVVAHTAAGDRDEALAALEQLLGVHPSSLWLRAAQHCGADQLPDSAGR